MTTAQRQRIRFWTLDCGYFVVEGPSEPDANGVVDVTIKHPRSSFPLRYLLAADGASVRAGITRRAVSNQESSR